MNREHKGFWSFIILSFPIKFNNLNSENNSWDLYNPSNTWNYHCVQREMSYHENAMPQHSVQVEVIDKVHWLSFINTTCIRLFHFCIESALEKKGDVYCFWNSVASPKTPIWWEFGIPAVQPKIIWLYSTYLKEDKASTGKQREMFALSIFVKYCPFTDQQHRARLGTVQEAPII